MPYGMDKEGLLSRLGKARTVTEQQKAFAVNETRFSNNFFEKRVSSFQKALQRQVFPISCFGTDISKLQKRKSIISTP